MNKYILSFLQDYLEWAEADAPASKVFEPTCGMCGNLGNYLGECTALDLDGRCDVRGEFSHILATESGCSDYPFGESVYGSESVRRTHHRNHERLEWVRNHLAKLDD